MDYDIEVLGVQGAEDATFGDVADVFIGGVLAVGLGEEVAL